MNLKVALPKDYAVLNSKEISVKGKIVIARYGKNWRGAKSRLGREHRAVGCLMAKPFKWTYKGKVLAI